MTAGLSDAPLDPLPKLPDGKKKPKKENASTGATAATMRALTARMFAFYFRAPMKAFFRTRVDYMGYARAINPYVAQNAGKWSWQATTPGLLVHAVQKYGWTFLPNHVLPPLLANTAIGSVLYISYLQTLGAFHEPSARSTKRVFPPPRIEHTFAAGFAAGTIQSLVAAPLDALQVRFRANDMLEGKYKHMWHYAGHKLQSIGLRGIFAGWSLSLVKDSLGAALFFSTFETIKSQAFYSFITRYYGSSLDIAVLTPGLALPGTEDDSRPRPILRPHYMIEPTFILTGGILASIAQQLILHPLSILQTMHYHHLETLDLQAQSAGASSPSKVLRLYYHAYETTLAHCHAQAAETGGWRRWLFRGFLGNTVRQVPSTSAGLIVFEIVRRRYAMDEEAVRIEKDGYDILLA